MNGEDNYSVGGQMDYLARYGEEIGKIKLAVNIDDVGFRGSMTNFSLYGVPEDLQTLVRKALGKYERVLEGEQWFAGDHMIFVQSERPAVAFTSSKCWDLMATITHTPDDVPENIDGSLLVELAQAVKDMVLRIDGTSG